jgi:hypothetical protein
MGMIPQIRKNQVEMFEEFIVKLLSKKETDVLAERMRQKVQGSMEVQPEVENEENS